MTTGNTTLGSTAPQKGKCWLGECKMEERRGGRLTEGLLGRGEGNGLGAVDKMGSRGRERERRRRRGGREGRGLGEFSWPGEDGSSIDGGRGFIPRVHQRRDKTRLGDGRQNNFDATNIVLDAQVAPPFGFQEHWSQFPGNRQSRYPSQLLQFLE